MQQQIAQQHASACPNCGYVSVSLHCSFCLKCGCEWPHAISQADGYAEREPLTIAQLVKQSFENSAAHGFHDTPINVAEKLALIHSEVSEALEEHRALRPTLYGLTAEGMVPASMLEAGGLKPEGIAAELADVVIRVADLCGALGINLEQAIRLKHAYNLTRPAKHGKAY